MENGKTVGGEEWQEKIQGVQLKSRPYLNISN
jgi:hypothetical protein